MSDLPPGLKDFGNRLEHAAELDVAKRKAAERPRERRGRRIARNVGLPVGAAVIAAAVSAGAVRVSDRGGEPIAPEQSGRGAVLQAAKDPAVVMATETPNPGGGPPWVLRVYTNAAGRDCAQIGRLRGGEFGQVLAGRFRAMPASASGTCAHPDVPGPLVAVSRLPSQELTLVYGIAVDRGPATIRVGDMRRRVRPSGLGAFMALFEGADPRGRVTLRTRVDGRTVERRIH